MTLKMNLTATNLMEKIRANKAVMGVLGLGYVGLPLSVAYGASGGKSLGFDIDAAKAELINSGKSLIKHIDDSLIGKMIASGQFSATSDMGRLNEPDALLICVPTPLTKHLEPDLKYVVATAEAISKVLRAGQIVILESTTYPGTTIEVLQPILEKSGLKAGVDFFLAFSPEREDPGNADYSTAGIPKVVGADDEASCALAVALYDLFVARTVPVSSSKTAEAVKITENIFRAVNIALVNELKVVYAAMGIDVWEVIDAAKTKPFGFMPFYPGPGLGGHCIPIDPFYLTWKAREFGMHTRFIELAGEVNSAMPRHVVAEMAKALDDRAQRGLNGSRILLIGLAYKKNIDDMRESPSLELIELLEARGAKVDYFDPFIPVVPMTREHAALAGRTSWAWSLEGLSAFDMVLIATDHDVVDYVGLAANAKLVVDARNACARAGADLTNVVPA